jgi:hypothetical protein
MHQRNVSKVISSLYCLFGDGNDAARKVDI